MTELFSRRALESRHRRGGRQGPVTLLSPPLKATLLMGLLIALCGAVWSVIARIPVTVSGTGVLLPVSATNSVLSGTNGTAIWLFNQPVQPWQQQARRFRHRPDAFDDRQMLALAQALLKASESIDHPRRLGSQQTAANLYTQNLKHMFRGRSVEEGRLLIWVQSRAGRESLNAALHELQRALHDTGAQTRNIRSNQRDLKLELSRQSAYLSSMQSLESRGFVSRAAILQQQGQVDSIRAQINGQSNQLIGLAAQSQQAYEKLRETLVTLINDQLIFSPRDSFLSQVVPNNGETVAEGAVIIELSEDPLDGAALVPMFLSSEEMAQVSPGMTILATPAGFRRSEVGGIRGVVVAKAKVPSGVDDIAARTGLMALAEMIQATEPAPMMAVVALERATGPATLNSGGYRWSSQGPLPFAPTPGERLDVEVITRNVAPITMVLPALRQFFGLTPPQRKPASSPAAVVSPQRQ